MQNESGQVKIYASRDDVLPFVDSIVAAADAHKNALGFFPSNVFREFAIKESLLVAVDEENGKKEYVGHLMFDCRFPKAHVLQVLALPSRRKLGIAANLLNHLKLFLSERNFISIHARVADDLDEAVKFWSKNEFYVQSLKKGGNSRNRTIRVFIHELETPQLFPKSGQDKTNPLGLDFNSARERPVYLLDLNVLFDLGPRRSRNEEVINLFKAERSGDCSLAVSTEIMTELRRTATQGRSDPMQDVVAILPGYSLGEGDKVDSLLDELAMVVFPTSARDRNLSPNQTSDLRHLATAIMNKLAGLITSDQSVLNAAFYVEQRYRVKVFSPQAFKSTSEEIGDTQVFETPDSHTFSVAQIEDIQLEFVRDFLKTFGIQEASVANEWAANSGASGSAVRLGAWLDGDLVGYITWPSWSGLSVPLARVSIQEASPFARSVATVLINKFLEQKSGLGAAKFSLEMPASQALVREIAWGFGFGGSENSKLSKITFQGVITEKNWVESRQLLLEKTGLKLPERPSTFQSFDQLVQVVTPSGIQTHLSWEELESLLSPVIFCLSGRPAVITPIKRKYAEPLLGHAKQGSLLPQFKSATYSEKNYMSGSTTHKQFKRGGLIFFYESSEGGGSKAVVALARVRKSYLKPNEAIESPDLDPSVLSTNDLKKIGASETKTVTSFDNVLIFSNPVPMKKLVEIGCGRPTDLISTKTILDSQMLEIISASSSSHVD